MCAQVSTFPSIYVFLGHGGGDVCGQQSRYNKHTTNKDFHLSCPPCFCFLQLLTQRDIEFAKEIDGERALAGIGSLDQANRRLLVIRRRSARLGRSLSLS